MANVVYPIFKQRLISPGVDLANGLLGTGAASLPTSAPLKVALVKSAYVYSAAHDFYNDVSANVVGAPVALANITVTGGVLDADDAVFSAVATGNTIGGVLLFMDTGTASTSPVVAFFDTTGGSAAISINTNDGNITVKWSSGASKIFAI